jgi:hypothetical protein
MPTLNFDDSFNRKERIILLRTFKSNCQELGIAGRDCTVTLRRANLGAPEMVAPGVMAMHEGAITRVDDDHFIIIMNKVRFSLFHATSTLGHEVVHLHQYLRDDMRNVKHSVTGEEGTWWKGKVFPEDVCNCREAYRHLPWEKEAFDKQPQLHDSAMRSLPVEDLYHIRDTMDLGRPVAS